MIAISSVDLVNDNLQTEMAVMIEKTDNQNILIQDDGPRIWRTHKDEEVVDNQNDVVSSEGISALFIPRECRSSAGSVGGDGLRHSEDTKMVVCRGVFDTPDGGNTTHIALFDF